MASGQCLCGAVSFEIDAPLSAPSLCHCSQCRRFYGSPCAAASAPASAYRIKGRENVSWYPTSKRAEQGFCKVCGSKLFWHEHDGTELDVTMGSLNGPTGLKLGRHIFTRSQGDYYEIGHDGVPRYAESSSGAQPIAPEPAPDAGPPRTEHSGGCECGAVRYRVTGAMRDAVICHCSQCRRNHGYPPAYSMARIAELTIDGEGNLAWFASSKEAKRGFCRKCGSSLFWGMVESDRIAITAGSLKAPTGLKTVRHVFVADKGDYYEIADGMPQDPGDMSAHPVTF